MAQSSSVILLCIIMVISQKSVMCMLFTMSQQTLSILHSYIMATSSLTTATLLGTIKMSIIMSIELAINNLLPSMHIIMMGVAHKLFLPIKTPGFITTA